MQALNILQTYHQGNVKHWIEFGQDGFRYCTQRGAGKPNHSSWHQFAFLQTDGTTIKPRFLDFYGYEDFNCHSREITQHFADLHLTDAMIKDICCTALAMLRANALYTRIAPELLIPIIEPAATLLIEGFKNGTNVFPQIFVNADEIENLKRHQLIAA